MEDNRTQPLDSNDSSAPTDPANPPSHPRRFIYRSIQPDPQPSHPLRRSTDTPRAFQGIAGKLCSHPVMLKFRVYLKLN
jgi:hypothetical protein